MDHVRLGKSGLKVSRLTLGCMTFGSPAWQPWVLDETASAPIIDKALEAGINFFDTADMYSLGESERVTGKLLLARRPRRKLVIATKVYNAMSDDPNDRGLSRKHIFESIDASLKRLGTDYVDLYQIHRFDQTAPLEETLEALSDVVKAGKALYLGASSMHAWQFMKALGLQRQNGWAPFVAMQNHYNLLYREEEREMLPLCRAEGVGVIPWSPLARGLLAGNRNAEGRGTARADSDRAAQNLYGGSREQDSAVIETVRKVAQRLGKPMAQIAYAWVASRPGVTSPIIGASKPEQLDDAVAALSLTLSDEDVAEIESAYRPKPVAGHI